MLKGNKNNDYQNDEVEKDLGEGKMHVTKYCKNKGERKIICVRKGECW